MNPLAKRIHKIESAVQAQMWGLILDYWDDALASDPEALELRQNLNDLFDSSTINPPAVFMPEADSESRRWYWFCQKYPPAREILEAMTHKVDKYVDSIGGFFAERKKNNQHRVENQKSE